MRFGRYAALTAAFVGLVAGGLVNAPTAQAGTQISPYGCYTRPVLRSGSQGECAKAVQWGLNHWIARTKQHIATQAITGKLTSSNATVIRSFQRAWGLAADASVGPLTWAAFEKEAALPATPPVQPNPPPQPVKVGAMKTPYACATRATLKSSSTGNCVRAVQWTLNSWLLRTKNAQTILPITGTFASLTTAALKSFQTAAGVTSSGATDARTWRALEKYSATTGNASIANVQSHMAFPAAAKLADNRILAVFRAADAHVMTATNVGTLWQAYSSDNGWSWTSPTKVNLGHTGGVSDPGLFVPASGPLQGRPVLTYFDRGATTTYAHVVVANDISGSTWGTSQEITMGGSSSFASAPVIQTGPSSFVMPGYAASAGYPYGAYAQHLSWTGTKFAIGRTILIARSTDGSWFTEPNLLRLPDGRLLALIRHDHTTGTHNTFRSYSADGGITWSALGTAFSGWGNPHMELMTNRKIVSSYRHLNAGARFNRSSLNDQLLAQSELVTSTDRPFAADGATAHGVPSGAMWAAYRVSADLGKTWGAESKLGDSAYEMAYSTPIEYQPGRIVFIWGDESSGTKSGLRISYATIN